MTSHKVFVIAEAGVNHNGSLDMARELIDVATAAGADAIKFQTYKTEKLVRRDAPKADYQKQGVGAVESQFDMLQRFEFDAAAHKKLAQHAQENKITFLSTPFDAESVDLLVNDIGVSIIKIPSGEITNGPLLLKIAGAGKPTILSTGMSTLDEIETALGVLAFGYSGWSNPSLQRFQSALAERRDALAGQVTLLHCTSEYPAAYADINLRAMDTIKTRFDLPVGLSDHSTGIVIPIAAVARGATIVEKHFTLDRNLSGPDHRASLEPDELKEMITAIRHVEAALGDGRKIPTPGEKKNAVVARKSLVAGRAIHKGRGLSSEDIAIKRAGEGISPMRYWQWIGAAAKRDYAPDEMLD
jgi:N-acetylneuraminate synthase